MKARMKFYTCRSCVSDFVPFLSSLRPLSSLFSSLPVIHLNHPDTLFPMLMKRRHTPQTSLLHDFQWLPRSPQWEHTLTCSPNLLLRQVTLCLQFFSHSKCCCNKPSHCVHILFVHLGEIPTVTNEL